MNSRETVEWARNRDLWYARVVYVQGTDTVIDGWFPYTRLTPVNSFGQPGPPDAGEVAIENARFPADADRDPYAAEPIAVEVRVL